jgi:hypothetical protein
MHQHCWSLFVFWLALTCSILTVRGQSSGCDLARTAAVFVSSNLCGDCTLPPVCSACNAAEQRVVCTSGCAYCDATTQSICGVMRKDVIVTYGIVPGLGFSSIYSVTDSFAYTKGRQGTVSYSWTTAGLDCAVHVNDQVCESCRRASFCLGKIATEANVNCTNLQAGATATACPLPLYFAGPIPLDELAINVTTGILAPFAFPHVLCQRGLVVLVPNPTPITAPNLSPSTPTSPNAAPTTTSGNQKCGLFKLGVFCFRGCGLPKKLLGWCQ